MGLSPDIHIYPRHVLPRSKGRATRILSNIESRTTVLIRISFSLTPVRFQHPIRTTESSNARSSASPVRLSSRTRSIRTPKESHKVHSQSPTVLKTPNVEYSRRTRTRVTAASVPRRPTPARRADSAKPTPRPAAAACRVSPWGFRNRTRARVLWRRKSRSPVSTTTKRDYGRARHSAAAAACSGVRPCASTAAPSAPRATSCSQHASRLTAASASSSARSLAKHASPTNNPQRTVPPRLRFVNRKRNSGTFQVYIRFGTYIESSKRTRTVR